MHLTTYRYGSTRAHGEGLRIGATRYLPRGVRREDWQRKNYFDVWMPLLSPDPEWLKKFLTGDITFASFTRHYHARMKQKECRQVIELLGTLALVQPLSLGCYCEDESRCHRSLLYKLITNEAEKRRAGFAELEDAEEAGLLRYASPVCYADPET